MAHMQKYKKVSVGAMTNHYDRTQEGTQKRDNIDSTRSVNNYIILSDDMTKNTDLKELTRRVKNRIENAIDEHKETTGKKPRSDAVLFGDWVVTLPKDCDQPDEFFGYVVDFMKLRYGSYNVLGGYVHNDETTPHMHIPVIPVVQGRLNAKAMFSRKELRSFHKDLQNYMDENGIQASVLLSEDDITGKLLSSIPQDKINVFEDCIEDYIEDEVDEKVTEVLEIREKNLEFKYKCKNDSLMREYAQDRQKLNKREESAFNREYEANRVMSVAKEMRAKLDERLEEVIKREKRLDEREYDVECREKNVETDIYCNKKLIELGKEVVIKKRREKQDRAMAAIQIKQESDIEYDY